MFTRHMVAVGIVLVIAVLMLLGVGYYRQRRNADTAEYPQGNRDDSFSSALAALHERDHEWSVTFQCPWCDTENDPEYTFCWNCAGELSPHTGWSPFRSLRR